MTGKILPQHEKRVLDAFPTLIGTVLLILVLYLICFFDIASNNTMRYLIQVFIYITLGEMWNLMSGYTGMTSLGQQLYIGLSGYCVAVATTLFRLPFGFGLLLGIVVCLALSVILSKILFRMQGMYFSIATWVVAEAFAMAFLNWKFVGQGGGLTIRAAPWPKDIYLTALSVSVLAFFAVFFLLRTRIGLGLAAMRDDISAAAAMGVDVLRHKLLVYVIAAVFTGLAGGIFFVHKGVIYPETGFGIGLTVSMIFIVTIGGVGTVAGPVVGAVIYVLLQEFLARWSGWSNIILGIVTILVILFLPDGIVGTLQKRFGFEIFSSRRVSFSGRR